MSTSFWFTLVACLLTLLLVFIDHAETREWDWYKKIAKEKRGHLKFCLLWIVPVVALLATILQGKESLDNDRKVAEHDKKLLPRALSIEQKARILRKLEGIPRLRVVVEAHNAATGDTADYANEVAAFLKNEGRFPVSQSGQMRSVLTSAGIDKGFRGMTFLWNATNPPPHSQLFDAFKSAGVECATRPDDSERVRQLTLKLGHPVSGNPLFQLVPTNTVKIIIGDRPVKVADKLPRRPSAAVPPVLGSGLADALRRELPPSEQSQKTR